MTDSRLPPFIHMVKDAIRTAVKVIKGSPKGIIADVPFQARRLSICKACELFIPESNRCQKCGCLMTRKVILKNASCPINKWGVEP